MFGGPKNDMGRLVRLSFCSLFRPAVSLKHNDGVTSMPVAPTPLLLLAKKIEHRSHPPTSSSSSILVDPVACSRWIDCGADCRRMANISLQLLWPKRGFSAWVELYYTCQEFGDL